MTPAEDAEAQKRAAAIAAVGEVEPGMLVGLGTGSTVSYAIAEIARRVRDGLRLRTVATSQRTEHAARAAGIEVIDFAAVAAVDLTIDGVDEIDPQFCAIKGGGGAMLREKIVADAASRMIAIADGSKSVSVLGTRPVPLEVLPFACALVRRRAQELGCEPALRSEAGVPFLTDQGNRVIDCRFARLDDPAEMAVRLSSIPGVLGHGLFLTEIDALYVGTAGGVERSDRVKYL